MTEDISKWNSDENENCRPKTAPDAFSRDTSIAPRRLQTNLNLSPSLNSPVEIQTTVQAPPPPSKNGDNEDGHIYHQLTPTRAGTKKGRMTHRRLLPIHVFMITVNATHGIGLYLRGSEVLETGGPLATLLCFLLLGLLAWAVMQCITEMLCIWPVPGALAVFVREFVDHELGIAVGITYWLSYSISFTTAIASSAAYSHYWSQTAAVDGAVWYLLVPLILVVINCFGIEIYGWFEVVTGVAKLICLSIIIIAMIVFVNQDSHNDKIKDNISQNWNNTTSSFDHMVADGWGTALFMCLSTATFAYVGVEIPAAVALEARPTKTKSTQSGLPQTLNEASSIGETIRFSSKWISVFACIAYTLSGILLSFSIDSSAGSDDSCLLVRVGWIDYANQTQCHDKNQNQTKIYSAFVLVASKHGDGGLEDAFNAFLVLTALSYGDPNEPWYLNILAWLGRTNSYRVPIRAMAVSALAFIWVPFLQLYDSGEDARINSFISILSVMGSVAVLIVWSCECWAFIRYYHCINRHKDELMEQRVPRVRRFDDGNDDDYPYRSNGQPLTAYLSLAVCLFILLVVNGASLWKKFYIEPFLSSYLLVILFALLWAMLKLWRGARWSLVDLSDPDRVISIIRGLHQFSFAGLQNESTPDAGNGSSLWPLSAVAEYFTGRKGTGQ
ncbi:amino acid permease-domain-containing protein [Hypoxylon fuscum]|nr:amino acid permease-domain-containing protein [Hypoxylon fuscum]